jgi:hypothetical protein
MFKWDGSDVSELIKDAGTKVHEAWTEKRMYWIIEREKEKEIVIVKKSSHIFACMIDELKPVFGLEKIGTHWVKIHSKIYILFKPEKDRKGEIIEELTLNEYKYDKNLENEIQKIFLFREIVGVPRNTEKNVILRMKGLYVQPLSFYESNLSPKGSGKVLSNLVLDKWFKNTDLDEAVCKFMGITSIEQINEILLPLHKKLEDVIQRTDPTSIMYVDEILSRLRHRFQSFLS